MYDDIKNQSKSLLYGRNMSLFIIVLLKFILFFSDLLLFGGLVYFIFTENDFSGIEAIYIIPILFVIIIFLIYGYFKFDIYVKIKYYSLFSNKIMCKGYSFKYVIKYILLRFYKFIKNILLFFLYMISSVCLTLIYFNMLKNGLNFYFNFIIIFADAGMLIYGLLCFIKDRQRFSYYNYCFFKNRNRRLKDIIKEGELLSEGQCHKIFKAKFKLLKYYCIGLFVIPSFYCIPLALLIETGIICFNDNEKSKAITYLAFENNDSYKSRISRSEG